MTSLKKHNFLIFQTTVPSPPPTFNIFWKWTTIAWNRDEIRHKNENKMFGTILSTINVILLKFIAYLFYTHYFSVMKCIQKMWLVTYTRTPCRPVFVSISFYFSKNQEESSSFYSSAKRWCMFVINYL